MRGGSLRSLILASLRSAERVSGEELARRAGVSRAAIWKQVSELRQLGYDIVGEPHGGYRLGGEPGLLHPWEMEPLLPGPLGRPYHHHRRMASTNLTAKALAVAGEPEGALVVAEEQTEGRGRLGRSWYSPPGGLWFSLLLRPSLSPGRMTELGPMAAVVLAEVLRRRGHPVTIKWPNDLLYREAKVGGILLETAGEPEAVEWAVLGVGLNVASTSFPEELRNAATLGEDSPSARREILAEIIADLNRAYPVFLSEGFRAFKEEWRNLSAILGRTVVASIGGKETATGVARDIDDSGRLLLETAGGTVLLQSGEVSLRPAAG